MSAIRAAIGLVLMAAGIAAIADVDFADSGGWLLALALATLGIAGLAAAARPTPDER